MLCHEIYQNSAAELSEKKECPLETLKEGKYKARHGWTTGTCIDFAYSSLNSGMVFGGIRECMNVFVVSIPNK